MFSLKGKGLSLAGPFDTGRGVVAMRRRNAEWLARPSRTASYCVGEGLPPAGRAYPLPAYFAVSPDGRLVLLVVIPESDSEDGDEGTPLLFVQNWLAEFSEND